ncbi:MAG: DNA translocase FtsK 4TM domain-containing protein [Alphaproteobacteria bacterium]
MAGRSTSSQKFAFLPSGATAFLRRRAIEIAGLMLLALAVVLAAALASFDPGDPSWNHAADGPAANLLGRPGAYAADLILQTLGLAGVALVLVLAAWAWRIVTHRGLPWIWLHLTLLPLTLLLVAVFAASLARPGGWPLASGLGGWLGDLLAVSLIGLALDFGLEPAAVLLTTTLGALAGAALVLTLGVSWEQWRALGRGLSWLGGRGAGAIALLRRARMPRRLRGREQRRARRAVAPAGRERPSLEPALEPALEAAPPAGRPARVARHPLKPRPGKRAAAENEPSLDLEPSGGYRLPPLSLLALPDLEESRGSDNADALEQNARLLESVLEDFGVRGEIVQVLPGPVVTLYELNPAPGTKTSRVIGLADDIARSMSAISVRVAVVPGQNVIGIELPNLRQETVYLRDLLASADFENTGHELALALGKDIGGQPVIVDLARMPHLLTAGTTGSGKSVALNAMILSLLYRLPPERCRLILIDPKMLELSVYDGVPHLLTPVVTDPFKAVVALKWAVREMERRYREMSKLGVRNVASYNQRLSEARAAGEQLRRTVQTGFDPESGEPIFEDQVLELEPVPHIVVVVDEMADLMMVAGKDVEAAIQRLAQMARAAGIHLIMATQRPSVDVITGTIKANFPTRISFQVTSKIDSRTILGDQGAEQLLGTGDMLYMAGGGRMVRVHGPYVSVDEVEEVVGFLKDQGTPDYQDEITVEPEPAVDSLLGGESGDALYDEAVALVCREGKASTSFVQRHLQIGYNRAARIIERMEAEAVVSPADRVGRREVLARDIGGMS